MQPTSFLDELRDRSAAADARLTALRAAYLRDLAERERRYLDEAGELQAELSALERLIEVEQRRGGSPAVTTESVRPDLGEFFVLRLAEQSPQSREELKRAAEDAGYFKDGESAGRKANTTLMNMARAGRISDLGGGNYGKATALKQLMCGMARLDLEGEAAPRADAIEEMPMIQ